MLEGWGEGQVSYWKQIFQALASHGRRKGASLAGDLESEEFYMVFWFWLNSAPSFMHMDKGILREDDVENSPPPRHCQICQRIPRLRGKEGRW